MLAITIVSSIPLFATLLLAARAGAVRRFLPHLTVFGAGALFGAATLHLVPEALTSGQAPWRVLLLLILGYMGFALIERLLARHNHAHAHGLELGAPSTHTEESTAAVLPIRERLVIADAQHGHVNHHEHRPTRSLVPLAFVGDTLHNLIDGMLIAAGFLTNPAFGFLTAAAIGLHELPREVGTYGLFVHSGVHPLRAVGFNLMTAMMAFAGALATLELGSHIAHFGTMLLPFAAGSYLYIAVAIARPVLMHRVATRATREVGPMAWMASGFALMGVSALAAHAF